jgi:hypothetical protein
VASDGEVLAQVPVWLSDNLGWNGEARHDPRTHSYHFREHSRFGAKRLMISREVADDTEIEALLQRLGGADMMEALRGTHAKVMLTRAGVETHFA